MTPEIAIETDRIPHISPVIPGNAGDPLPIPLVETRATFHDILTCTRSQDAMRVDTRLKTGMTNTGPAVETGMNPMRPSLNDASPAHSPFPTTRSRVPLGWLGRGSGRPGHHHCWMNPMRPSSDGATPQHPFNHSDTKPAPKRRTCDSSFDINPGKSYVGGGTRCPNAARLFWKEYS